MRVLCASIGGLAFAGVVGAFIASQVLFTQPTPSPTIPIVARPTEPEKPPPDPKDAAYRQKLTPEQYHITREKGTETAFTGRYWNHKGVGIYKCVCCGSRLFDSKAKFDSDTGWPSFFEPIDEKNIRTAMDFSLFNAPRTEVMCGKCGAHLGHVFDNGPQPTGLRYCINSASLVFQESQPKREP
jgi:peptide-methionine (R)-S-oxide reductase